MGLTGLKQGNDMLPPKMHFIGKDRLKDLANRRQKQAK